MTAPHFSDVCADRLSRRGFLVSGALFGAAAGGPVEARSVARLGRAARFASVPENVADTVTVPPGFEWRVVFAWGDPLYDTVEPAQPSPGSPFPPTRAQQEQRVGMNNDMFVLFDRQWTYPWRTGPAREMIACVNNEYVSPTTFIPPRDGAWSATPGEVEAMYAAVGVTVCRLGLRDGDWTLLRDEKPGAGLNRRITPFTEVIFDGPASRHPWLAAAAATTNRLEGARSGAPRQGGVLCGTQSNCAGGYTPWGTYLTAEENIDGFYFTTDPEAPGLKAAAAEPGWREDQTSFRYANRWPLGGPGQFDLSQNPTGPMQYGWIVEIDPHDPSWAPRKRTALGRKKNECATTVLTRDGRVAVYMGDDQFDEFVYKFVSRGRFDPVNRTANRELLSDGDLYAARFEADGTGRWLKLELGAANAAASGAGMAGFADDGEMMIRVRQAARALGATPMDRPEDVEAPKDAAFRGQGDVLVVLTKSPSTTAHPANPRQDGPNRTGQIVRLMEAGGDHAATTFGWTFFALGGDPASATARSSDGRSVASSWVDGKATTSGDRFACPDNVCFDGRGYAWITTDGNEDVFASHDGVFVMPVTGDGPRPVKRFLTAPVGAEVCGPWFSADGRSFFCGIQHPGQSGPDGPYLGREPMPPSSFPHGAGNWPRPAVIQVRRKDGQPIRA
jgi:secreted PhoX family phosphatase